MKINIIFEKGVVSLNVFLLMVCVACSPTRSSTIETLHTPGHFSPLADLPFEFDYPVEWGDYQINSVYQDEGSIGIILFDPKGPTPDPKIRNSHQSRGGTVAIWKYEYVRSDALVENVVETRSHGSDFELLNRYTVDIGPYSGTVLEYKQQPDYTMVHVLTFLRETYVYDFDRDQWYLISLEIPYEEREGAFEKGYDLLLESLKINP